MSGKRMALKEWLVSVARSLEQPAFGRPAYRQQPCPSCGKGLDTMHEPERDHFHWDKNVDTSKLQPLPVGCLCVCIFCTGACVYRGPGFEKADETTLNADERAYLNRSRIVIRAAHHMRARGDVQ